uniref:Signal peptidase complex subunit 2 n=1 Tax=Globisporangium ultimum (strain ATCC 200006 / CBS 805.95 / DAOM BR144) TaxID=431595 RepID=K3X3Y9_GLOUD
MGAGSSAQRKLSEDKPAEEELVLNELKVETGDQNAVKNMLDDAIAEYFQEKNEYTIHYGWDNVKLLLMMVATAIAVVSHFYKHPAISERVLIYSCVGGFFFIHALLLGYSVFVEKNTILRMSKKGTKTPVVLVQTDFPCTEENYTICMQREGQKEKQVKVELYVGRFFDKEGYFSKDAFIKDLETIVSRFQKVKKQ